MVGAEKILETFSNYKYSTEELTDRRKNIAIYSSTNDKLRVDCVLTDDHLTEVYFLNNQFYELDEESLLNVISDILEANYSVHSSFLGRTKWIITKSLSAGPERTTKDKLAEYKDLPSVFTRVAS